MSFAAMTSFLQPRTQVRAVRLLFAGVGLIEVLGGTISQHSFIAGLLHFLLGALLMANAVLLRRWNGSYYLSLIVALVLGGAALVAARPIGAIAYLLVVVVLIVPSNRAALTSRARC
jgi:hypothetical protein